MDHLPIRIHRNRRFLKYQMSADNGVFEESEPWDDLDKGSSIRLDF